MTISGVIRTKKNHDSDFFSGWANPTIKLLGIKYTLLGMRWQLLGFDHILRKLRGKAGGIYWIDDYFYWLGAKLFDGVQNPIIKPTLERTKKLLNNPPKGYRRRDAY